jgi:hypothetical protein
MLPLAVSPFEIDVSGRRCKHHSRDVALSSQAVAKVFVESLKVASKVLPDLLLHLPEKRGHFALGDLCHFSSSLETLSLSIGITLQMLFGAASHPQLIANPGFVFVDPLRSLALYFALI